MKHKSTISVHAGQSEERLGVVNPIEPSSAFQYVDSGEKFYPRYFNTPNQNFIVEKLKALEHAEAGAVFGSGMAAISTTLHSLLKPGDHIVLLENLYGGTLAFANQEFPDLGIEFSLSGPAVSELISAVRPNTRAIFVESPANPLMQLVDLGTLAEAARARNITTIADNTFASPINQNPIDFGIDIVIHSGTKYLGGHSDLSFGAVLGSQEIIEGVRKKGANYGGSLNALTCYLIERSLKTLDVRVERQNHNALEVARFLAEQPGIERVNYAGLETHPNHEWAARQMNGFGGMLSFKLTSDRPARELLNRFQLISPAMSLGGVETTATMPVYTSHQKVDPEERARLGITDQLVRISVGIEGAEDIIADLRQALAAFTTSNLAVNG